MEDLHKRWPHRWLNSKAIACASKIQGTGVFAKEKIFKGEPVGILGGVIVHKSQIAEYRMIMGHVGLQIDDDLFIVPTTRDELEKYGVFNHSCDPNIGFSNSITFIAIRDIEPTEELVLDYAFGETFYKGFNCHCGAITCRKKIHSDDWNIKEIQNKYGDFFSPYLRRKFLLKSSK